MPTALETLRPTLDALPSADVRAPDQPIEIYFQETEDVLTHVAEHDLAKLMVDEGLEQETLDGVRPALAAAREAQTTWTLAYEREKPDEQRKLEARGYGLRSSVAKKARFALRKHSAGLAVLHQILEGDGVADLVQDLDDLGMLMSRYAPQFARNKNFDATATRQELATVATGIRAGLAGYRMSAAQTKAVDLRNRAWTHLDELVDDLREAGRAVSEGKVARGFGSAYERRTRARRRKSDDGKTT